MRIVAFIALLVFSTIVPWYVFAALVLGYALVWNATELLLIGVCVDVYFGLSSSVPLYTVLVAGTLCVSEWIKPLLIVYNDTYRL